MDQETQLRQLFNDAKPRSFAKGQIIINPDDTPRGVYYILSGYVKAYDIDMEGEIQFLGLSGPGEIMPLYWSLGDSHLALFHEAMSDTETLILPKEEFDQRLSSNVALLREIIRVLIKSFRHSQERIQNLEYRTAQERLAYRILFLGEYYGTNKAGRLEIDVPMTYPDLAQSINMTRETVNRTMRRLVKDGLVNFNAQHISILQPGKLQEMLGQQS